MSELPIEEKIRAAEAEQRKKAALGDEYHDPDPLGEMGEQLNGPYEQAKAELAAARAAAKEAGFDSAESINLPVQQRIEGMREAEEAALKVSEIETQGHNIAQLRGQMHRVMTARDAAHDSGVDMEPDMEKRIAGMAAVEAESNKFMELELRQRGIVDEEAETAADMLHGLRES